MFFLEHAELKEGACVFGYYVTDPERYGVVEFDTNQESNKSGGETLSHRNPTMLLRVSIFMVTM